MSFFNYFTSPTSFSVRSAGVSSLVPRNQYAMVDNALAMVAGLKSPHSQHPNFGHLTLLVFEAVLEVVCVSLPGYIVARQGMFDAESQKFLANLNVTLFTPCLIFTKLASQLTAEKLLELSIIPVIFIVQTIVSWLCAWGIAKCLGFKKRQSNFLIAMGVFGNSNSLPISLVISLSKTLNGLHWDKIPHDNDNEVQARGILYLLIFQQLGQLLRWSWGFNVLLAPADKYTEEEGGIMRTDSAERGRYRDDDPRHGRLISPLNSDRDGSDDDGDDQTRVGDSPITNSKLKTPQTVSAATSRTSSNGRVPDLMPTPTNGMIAPQGNIGLGIGNNKKYDEETPDIRGQYNKFLNTIRSSVAQTGRSFTSTVRSIFTRLPLPLQKFLSTFGHVISRFFAGVWEFMNPPLWAMLIAIVVASVPQLQHAFFSDGTFVRNSVTRAVEQAGGVAVPLILVVLGGNLARNTIPKDNSVDITDPKEEQKLLIASLVSRMLLPTIIMAPLLALTAKYVPVSIVDDKIFVIVCFLLTGAPTALQLAQICQVNNVYMSVMSRILFQSYVIWILPSTLVLVLLALETVEWAT